MATSKEYKDYVLERILMPYAYLNVLFIEKIVYYDNHFRLKFGYYNKFFLY